MRFLGPLGVVRKNKWHQWIPEQKLLQMHTFLGIILNRKIWPFLTWPWPDLIFKFQKITSDERENATIDFYGQNSPENMCHTTQSDLWFSWPFVTWPWPWSLLSMVSILMGYLHHTIESTLGEFGQNHANWSIPRSQNVKTLHFDLWPDLDLTRDLLRTNFWVL